MRANDVPVPRRFLFALACCILADVAWAQTTVVSFDNGAQGWLGGTVENSGGNPGAAMHIQTIDFGMTLANGTNNAFIGNLAANDSLSIGLDVKADSISQGGDEFTRNLLVEFRSHALAPTGYPWASVWYVFGPIQADTQWSSFDATVDNPASTVMPPGWGGYGAEDPVTFEPMLPPGVTFADVMANVDEVAFTTLQPGYFYIDLFFNVRMDNLRISRIPLPDIIFSDGFDTQQTH